MKVTNKLSVRPELKKFFAENGLLLGNVAEKTGIARQTLHNVFKSGKCTPPIAKKICDCFGIYMWDYFIFSDEENEDGKKD